MLKKYLIIYLLLTSPSPIIGMDSFIDNLIMNSLIKFTEIISDSMNEQQKKDHSVQAKNSKNLQKKKSIPCETQEVPVHFDGTNTKEYEHQWNKIIIAHLNRQHEYGNNQWKK